MTPAEVGLASACAALGGVLAFYVLYPFVLPARASAVAACAAGLAVAAALLLPRGGATGAQVLLRALRPMSEPAEETFRSSAARLRYDAELRSRFAAPVPFLEDRPLASRGDWKAGHAAGREAWLDGRTGMVWSAALPIQFSTYAEPDWRAALDACRLQEPAATWSLPSMAEFLIARRHRAGRVVDDWRHENRWFAAVFIPDLAMTAMGLFGVAPSGNQGGQASPIGVRCVGRGPGAPPEGYPVADTTETLSALAGEEP